MNRRWLIAAVAVLALFGASCGQDPDDATPDAPPTDSSPVEAAPEHSAEAPEASSEDPADDDGATVEEEELEGALVDSFPAEVPLYDGEIDQSYGGMDEVSGAPEWAVLMTTGDPIEVIDPIIREAYSTDGWQIATEMEFMGGYQLIARKAGSYTVSITYHDATGPMIIQYGVSRHA